MRRLCFALVMAAAMCAAVVVAQAPATYRITHTYPVGGDGSWDYVVPDPPQHRIFIGRQDRIMVVDTNDGTLIGEVTGIDGAHGVAVASKAGHGFATSGNDGTVRMFDLKTFKVLGSIPAAEDADAVIYDAASNRVFTFNGDAHSSTVIDPDAGKLVTNIPLGGKPEYGASAGDGKVYGNLTDTSEVVEIDAKQLRVARRWSTAPCKQPVAMAIDVARHRLFSGCRSGVMAVSDYQAGKVVATFPIGTGVDGAGYDPATGDAFASSADGTLTVIHQDGPDAYHVVETVQTAQGSRNMGLDPTTHRIFLPGAKFGPLPAADTAKGGRARPPMIPGSFVVMVVEREAAGPYSVLKTAKVGGLGGFDYIYADVANRRLYIPRGAVQGDNPKPGRVTVFDLDTLAPVTEIPDIRANGAAVDAKSGHGFASSSPVAMWDAKTLKPIKTIEIDAKSRPDGIYADPFNQRVYVFSHPTADATVIDAKDGKLLGTIDLGGAPEQAVSDGKGRLYVVIQDKSNVAVVDAAAMKVTAHYEFGDKGSRCNGLALDAKNQVLFAACGQSGNPPATPAQPVMIVLDAKTGNIITTLPLAGGSDGAVFNPATMEAFSSHGNGTMTIVKEKSPTSFEVEQNLQTMAGAKCLTLDTKTNRLLTDAAEFGPAPPPPPPDPNNPAGARRGGRGPMLPDSFAILVIGK